MDRAVPAGPAPIIAIVVSIGFVINSVQFFRTI
jgi:hypothetical protein